MTAKWYTIIISLLIEKPFYLLRPQSFSFQIVSEFIDTFVKFSNFMSQGWGFWLPVLSLGEGSCTQWLSQGEGFCSLQVVSRGFVPEEGMVLDETDTCIRELSLTMTGRGAELSCRGLKFFPANLLGKTTDTHLVGVSNWFSAGKSMYKQVFCLNCP